MFKKILTLFLFLALVSCSKSDRDLSIATDASSIEDSITLINSSIDGNIELEFYDLSLPFSFTLPSVETFKTSLKLSEVSFFDGEIISEIICPSTEDVTLELNFDVYEEATLNLDQDIYQCVGSDGSVYTVRFKIQSSSSSHAIVTSFDFINNLFYGQVLLNRVGDGLGYKELYF